MTVLALLASPTPAPVSHPAGSGLNSSVVLGLAVFLVLYLASLYLFPLKQCRACHGYGRIRRVFTLARCRRCDGTGRTLRFGARLVARHHR